MELHRDGCVAHWQRQVREVMGGDGLKYWINGQMGRTNLKNGRALGRKLAGEYNIRFAG